MDVYIYIYVCLFIYIHIYILCIKYYTHQGFLQLFPVLSRMETSRVPSTSADPRSSVIRSRVPVLKGVTSNYWEDHGILAGSIWSIWGIKNDNSSGR